MSHWIIAPIALPLAAGSLILLIERHAPRLAARLSLLAILAGLAIAIGLLVRASAGEVDAYLVGNWRVPFGIALALDRLAALMLVLTFAIALLAALYAMNAAERDGAHFHALLQFQIMGLAGAFLTADLFNLFVFFEVLLAASYGLLLHGRTAARARAAIHYVSFNLTGSALFLIGVALLFAATGTLNMADAAERIGALPEDRATLARAAGLLLLVVFAVKAALLPLYFWLPETYASAVAPVAALFAIMTKVGFYAIARVFTLVFGAELASPWLPWLALATLVAAGLGALSAVRLPVLAAYLVIASAGTLLLAVGLATESTIAAGLFYLIPSTLVAAALFLVFDRIAIRRSDVIDDRAWDARRTAIGLAFLVCAVSVAALPPLGGFLGKALLLAATADTPLGVAVWAVVLASGLAIIVALARAGSTVFWKASESAAGSGPTTHVPQRAAIGLAIAGLVGTSVFAGPIASYTHATASQLLAREPYLRAVLDAQPVPPAWNPRAGGVK